MTASISRLPAQQVAVLERGYRQEIAVKRRRNLLFTATLAIVILLAARVGEVDPGKFVAGFPRFFSYFYDILPTLRLGSLSADISEWFWNFDGWLLLLIDTLLIAYVGTVLGAIGGFALCFVASANLVRLWPIRAAARRTLEIWRSVPEIVYALIFVFAFGLGPFPGVLAIAIHTAGALGKLFAEVVENIDMKPVEGISSAGGSWLQTVRFAVLPQVLPNFVSYALLRFEINVRGASVLGFVGAGGIGKELLSSIRQFYYADVSAILLMILATVVVIDLATEWLRHRLIGRGHMP